MFVNLFDSIKGFLIPLIELFVGIVSIIGIKLKMQTPNDGMSKKDLFKMIEEKDRQIERLIISNHAQKMRYDHLKKRIKK